VTDFVEEVEERLRSDRYRDFLRRAWPWFAAAFVAIVIGWLAAWGYNVWRDRNISRASVAYDKGITALAQGDGIGAYTLLDPVAKSGPPAYRTLALLQQGNIRAAAGKTADAVALWDAAAKAAPNEIFGDLARLKSAQALLDTAPFAALQARLTPLIGEKKPLDLEARESLAMARLRDGQTRQARDDFNAISLTLGAGQSIRQRAQAAVALIDAGQAGVIQQIVKAAAALPPAAPPGAAPAGAAGPPTAGPQPGAGDAQ
jgi:hypothetical protein